MNGEVKMKKTMAFVVFLLILSISACTPNEPVDTGSFGDNGTNGDDIGAMAPTEVPKVTPSENDCTAEIPFVFQREKPLSMEPLQVLNESTVKSVISEQIIYSDITQGFYRSSEAELVDVDIYSYIEIDGVKYDLGKIAFGEDNVLSLRSGYADYRFMTVRHLKLDASDATIYQQSKGYGTKSASVSYYIIKNGVPVFLTEVFGVEKYTDFDASGVTAILSTDRAVRYTEWTVSKLDLRKKVLHFTVLNELLKCDSVDYSNGRFYTSNEPPNLGQEPPIEGYTYSLNDRGFVPKD
jgi:hypothetical protein